MWPDCCGARLREELTLYLDVNKSVYHFQMLMIAKISLEVRLEARIQESPINQYTTFFCGGRVSARPLVYLISLP